MAPLDQLFSKADRHCRQNEPEQAIQLYQRILEQQGAPVEVNLRLGELYQALGQMREAARCYRIVADRCGSGPVKLAALKQLVDLEPDRPEHHLRLAELHHRSGQPRQAFQAYSKAAELMVFSERPDSAVLVLDRLAQLMPNNQALREELRRLRNGEDLPVPTLLDVATVVEFRPTRLGHGNGHGLLPSVEGDPMPPLAPAHAKTK